MTMTNGKVISIHSQAKKPESGNVAMLLKSIEKCAQAGDYIYAQLDHAATLGRYEADGAARIGVAGKIKALEEELAYLQELRIFNAKQELRAIRRGDSFCWRLRIDEDAADDKRCVWQEKHKLWGHALQSGWNAPSDDWTTLSSQRGTEILFPGRLEEHAEVAVLVRNYIVFGRPSDGEELLRFADERLVGFERWGDGNVDK